MMSLKSNTLIIMLIIRKPLFMSLFVSAFLQLVLLLTVTAHARTLLDENYRRYGAQVSDDLEMATYSSSSWDVKIMQYTKPSPPSPPPPESPDSPDQSTKRSSSTSPLSGETRTAAASALTSQYDSSDHFSTAENYKIRSVVEYYKKAASSPPSSSKSPVTHVVKPSAAGSSHPPPASSESPVQIHHNSPHIPTTATSI